MDDAIHSTEWYVAESKTGGAVDEFAEFGMVDAVGVYAYDLFEAFSTTNNIFLFIYSLLGRYVMKYRDLNYFCRQAVM